MAAGAPKTWTGEGGFEKVSEAGEVRFNDINVDWMGPTGKTRMKSAVPPYVSRSRKVPAS